MLSCLIVNLPTPTNTNSVKKTQKIDRKIDYDCGDYPTLTTPATTTIDYESTVGQRL